MNTRINKISIAFAFMLGISKIAEGAEDVRLGKVTDDHKFNKNKKNIARTARYYRSSALKNEDESEMTAEISSPDNLSDLMPAESRLSKSQEVEKFEREHKHKREHEDDYHGNDETEVLKKQSNPVLSKGQAYALPINYEYPELVRSLKTVYKEMFITSGLYLLNIVSAVGIVLVNKYIYTYYKFPYGLVLTLYHFVLTSIGLQILAGLKFFPVKPVSLMKVLPLSVSFCSYVVLTNLSLQYNSGTFYQVQFE